MNIKIKNKSDFERVVHLTLVDDDFQEERKTSIANIGKELKIKGFRPGKVPPQIVEREVGNDYINQNAIELALPRLVFDFLKEKELIRTLSAGKITLFNPLINSSVSPASTIKYIEEFISFNSNKALNLPVGDSQQVRKQIPSLSSKLSKVV